MRLSCIGIGSNAIRLLTAGWDGTRLTDSVRCRRGTRLFAGLQNGRLTEESMRKSADAVAELASLSRQSGADGIGVFATSAVRDAENGEDFIRLCEETAGLRPEILSGEEEAVYSYLGACRGDRAAVVDIGGGSTELIFGRAEEPEKACSMPLGAVRLAREAGIRDAATYEAAVEAALARVREEDFPIPVDCVWTGVGGTMTTLGAMMRAVPLFHEGGCEGMTAALADVMDWGRRLSALSVEKRRETVGLMPKRADIIPAGLAILEAVLRAYGCARLVLSNQGNMDGYLKKKFRALT